MEKTDLPPPYSSVTKVTMPSADVLISPPEVVVKETRDDEPLASNTAHAFEDKRVRAGFIQKILLFVLLQNFAVLMVMVIMDYKRYVILHETHEKMDAPVTLQVFITTTLCAYLAMLGLIIFCDKARTQNPYKIIIYVVYPAVYGLFGSFSTLNSTFDELFITWIFYCVAILVLLMFSIFTFQTKWEFTTKTGIMVSGIVLLVVFSITALVSPRYARTSVILYYTLAMFVECAYTVWDIQQMTSPKYRYAITPKDYVLGVLLIRIDYICYIAMFIKKSLVNCLKD